MKRKVQTGRQKAALLAVIGAIGSLLGLRAETYYWTGAVDNALSKAGNWSLTDGGPAASKAPGQGDTVIFNNTEALSLAKSGHIHYLRYFFNGASVSIPASGSLRHYGYGGGGIWVTGSGTYTFTYPLELNANQFTGEDKTFVVDVAEGASVVVNNNGTTKIYSPAHFIKRGGGTYKATQFIETKSATAPRGDLTFEAGTLTTERPSERCNYFGVFTVAGAASKEFTQDAMSVRIDRYVETPEAAQTLTFHQTAGVDYVVELTGAYDVPRCSAVVSAVYNTDNTLKWNPDGSYKITMVSRVWDSNRGKILVDRGTMRFAEGAGIKSLISLAVSQGATLEIAQDASPVFSGAPIALAEGATLKVEGKSHYFCPKSISYNGTAVPGGVYTAEDFDWLEGDGYLVVAPATRPALTLYWTGAAGEATPKMATAANWRCADGSQVESLLTADTLIFTNDAALAFSSENLSLVAGRTVIKRGTGKLTVKQVLPASSKDITTGGELVFESGVLTTPTSNLPSDRNNYFGALTVTGSETKTLHLSALSANVRGYSETLDASKTLTFNRSYGNDYNVNLVCTGNVARFSADVKVTADTKYISLLKWSPTDDYMITMVDRVWDTDFGVVVDRGTMRFANGAGFTRLSHGLTVKSGAKVEIAADAGPFVGSTVVVNLEEDAALKLEGDKLISAVTYRGEPIADGVYAAGDFSWLEGEGRLVVGSGSPADTVTASWTGNGDRMTITDPANWGETGATELPDFASGKLVATFPAKGTIAIPEDKIWKFKGIVVDPNGEQGDELQITGDGEMWIGSEGLVSRGLGGVTIGVKTSVVSSNPWIFGATTGGGSLVFNSSAEVETIADAVWTVHSARSSYGGSGDGPFLKLQCSNPNLKDSYFKLPVKVSADAALGGANSVATIDCGIKSYEALELTRCHLLNKQIFFEDVQAMSYLRTLKSTGCVEVDGELYFRASNGYFWHSSFPSVTSDMLTVRGGWRTSSSSGLSRAAEPYANGYKVLVETGLTANKFYLSQWGWFYVDGEIDVPGGVFLGDGAYLRLEENASFKQGTSAKSVAGIGFTRSETSTQEPGTLDLQGHDATLQILAGGEGIVTSEDAAMLTLNADTEFVTPQSRGWEAAPTFSTKIGSDTDAPSKVVDIKEAQQTDHASFQGCANFVKTGSLPHWMGGVSTSTGTVTVAEGVLTFMDGAKWRTASSVTVSGTGVLGIEGNKVLSAKTDLVVTGDEEDRIRIAEGKKLVVKSLTVNGVEKTEVPAGLVTGGGELQIGSERALLLLIY